MYIYFYIVQVNLKNKTTVYSLLIAFFYKEEMQKHSFIL